MALQTELNRRNLGEGDIDSKLTISGALIKFGAADIDFESSGLLEVGLINLSARLEPEVGGGFINGRCG